MSRRRIMTAIIEAADLSYTPIKYIESQNKNAGNGNANYRQGTFIKTGVFPNSDCRLEMRFKTLQNQIGWTSFFGMMFSPTATTKVRSHLIYHAAIPSTEIAALGIFYPTGDTGVTVPVGTDITLVYDNGTFTVNGESYTAPSAGVKTSAAELVILDHYLFDLAGGLNHLTALIQLEAVTLHTAEGVKLLDYQPCQLNDTNEVGMWDLVSDSFKGASNNPKQPPLSFIAGARLDNLQKKLNHK